METLRYRYCLRTWNGKLSHMECQGQAALIPLECMSSRTGTCSLHLRSRQRQKIAQTSRWSMYVNVLCQACKELLHTAWQNGGLGLMSTSMPCIRDRRWTTFEKLRLPNRETAALNDQSISKNMNTGGNKTMEHKFRSKNNEDTINYHLHSILC